MKISQSKARIISNCRISGNYYKIILRANARLGEASPGQFAMLKAGALAQPLLRRPLSIHRIRGAQIEFLYEIIGAGTQALSQERPGAYLDMIGPLGNGFELRAAGSGQRPILIAGGMGVAPLLFLAQKIVREKPVVLLGARTRNHLLCEKEFKALGCDVRIATDDGSKGYKGYVSGLLNILLSAVDCRLLTIYACGPKPMLKKVTGLVKKRNIPAQISLEAHMSCGFGACLGCVVDTIDGYRRVCKEGPVFNADAIIW